MRTFRTVRWYKVHCSFIFFRWSINKDSNDPITVTNNGPRPPHHTHTLSNLLILSRWCATISHTMAAPAIATTVTIEKAISTEAPIRLFSVLPMMDPSAWCSGFLKSRPSHYPKWKARHQSFVLLSRQTRFLQLGVPDQPLKTKSLDITTLPLLIG